jgi:8-oxo-dGTP diphosphatase
MSDGAISAPIPRPTARVLLLDPSDRILLMKGRLPSAPERPGAWFTLGGGVEPGESFAAAAAREIVEETGVTTAQLGPAVWRREGVMALEGGRPHLFQEVYFLARCEAFEPDRSGWNAVERALIDDIRWWTLAELDRTSERAFPPGLAERLGRLLRDGPPAEPEAVPWT